MERKASAKTLGLVQLALLGALIFILAFTPFIGYIPLGVTRATIVHIPVIVGALLGYVGAQEGGVFWTLFALNAFTVGLGEALVTYILGLPLLRWIEKAPALRQFSQPL